MRKFSFSFLKKISAREFRFTFSTALTVLRIALTPFIVGALIYQSWNAAFILFVIAALTDFFDGMIARYFQQKTFLGACLDPLADKLLLLSVFVTIALLATFVVQIPAWFVWLMILRELIIVGGIVHFFLSQKSIIIAPTFLGKATTCVQMIFLTWLFLCQVFNWIPWFYDAGLDFLAFFMVVSLLQYAIIAYWQIKKGAS